MTLKEITELKKSIQDDHDIIKQLEGLRVLSGDEKKSQTYYKYQYNNKKLKASILSKEKRMKKEK